MTKPPLNYFLIAALALSAAFTSCGSRGSGGAKSLENISESESALNVGCQKFEVVFFKNTFIFFA